MKILDFGVAVIDGDTHISKWVEQHRKLNIAENMIAPFAQFIRPGSTVIDIGAMIGDHTITYSRLVGENGRVYAFEPNPEAFMCLRHNMRDCHNVTYLPVAIGEAKEKVSMLKDQNAGASHISKEVGDVCVQTLDSFELTNVSFIKIDAEGYEPKILRGAAQTIQDSRPMILCEFNDGALCRYGSSSMELKKQLEHMGYKLRIIDKRIRWSGPQYDVICIPERQ